MILVVDVDVSADNERTTKTKVEAKTYKCC